jgi:hypothetical protein
VAIAKRCSVGPMRVRADLCEADGEVFHGRRIANGACEFRYGRHASSLSAVVFLRDAVVPVVWTGSGKNKLRLVAG